VSKYWYINLTDPTVADNRVAGTDNNAAFGAGIYSNATLALTRCTISGNSIRGRDGNYTTFPADALGGGIYSTDTTLNVINCTVSGNSSVTNAAGGNGADIGAFEGRHGSRLQRVLVLRV